MKCPQQKSPRTFGGAFGQTRSGNVKMANLIFAQRSTKCKLLMISMHATRDKLGRYVGK